MPCCTLRYFLLYATLRWLSCWSGCYAHVTFVLWIYSRYVVRCVCVPFALPPHLPSPITYVTLFYYALTILLFDGCVLHLRYIIAIVIAIIYLPVILFIVTLLLGCVGLRLTGLFHDWHCSLLLFRYCCCFILLVLLWWYYYVLYYSDEMMMIFDASTFVVIHMMEIVIPCTIWYTLYLVWFVVTRLRLCCVAAHTLPIYVVAYIELSIPTFVLCLLLLEVGALFVMMYWYDMIYDATLLPITHASLHCSQCIWPDTHDIHDAIVTFMTVLLLPVLLIPYIIFIGSALPLLLLHVPAAIVAPTHTGPMFLQWVPRLHRFGYDCVLPNSSHLLHLFATRFVVRFRLLHADYIHCTFYIVVVDSCYYTFVDTLFVHSVTLLLRIVICYCCYYLLLFILFPAVTHCYTIAFVVVVVVVFIVEVLEVIPGVPYIQWCHCS